MTKTSPEAGKTLSELTAEIDAAVVALESNELPLEDAISLYEMGIQLLKVAQARLSDAQQQVRELNPSIDQEED